MSTRNFVPRADGEGSIGTAAKNWLSGYFKQLNVADVTVDASKKPTSDTTDLTTLLSNLATMIKQNKGTDDWKTAPATNLATLAALVGNLASGSDVTWKGNKFTNAKLGITGLMEKNGYICFGKNFGGLIIQWGSNSHGWVAFPLAFAQFRKLVTNHQGVTWMQSQARESNTLAGFTLDVGANDKSDCDAQWIAIGL